MFESYRWDGTGEHVDGGSQSQKEGRLFLEGRVDSSHPPPPHVDGCHIGAVTCSATHSQTCPPLRGIHTLLLRHKIKKKKKKITNKNKTEEIRRVGRRERGRRSGQVAVCVLLPVHSLQVLLLYQDVNAFLFTRGRQNPNMTLSKHQDEDMSIISETKHVGLT